MIASHILLFSEMVSVTRSFEAVCLQFLNPDLLCKVCKGFLRRVFTYSTSFIQPFSSDYLGFLILFSFSDNPVYLHLFPVL